MNDCVHVEVELLAMVLEFWLQNVPQERVDKSDFQAVSAMYTRVKRIMEHRHEP